MTDTSDLCESGGSDGVFDRVVLFIWAMTFLPEYRSVFYFRHRTLGHLLALLCPPMKSLALFAKKTCGPGMLVHHGFGTTVTAEEIGANFTIKQLATVGYVNNSIDCPKIGSNVTIGVGARVLGGVTIGDDVVDRREFACDIRCPCGCDSYGSSIEDSVSKTHCRKWNWREGRNLYPMRRRGVGAPRRSKNALAIVGSTC